MSERRQSWETWIETVPERSCWRDSMSDEAGAGRRAGIVLQPGEGRPYPMGRISALFKADGDETRAAYSVSEWWLEPHTQGPGPHSHEEDDVFYVLEGTMTFLLGDRWVDAPRGAFVLAPGGMTHDFQNRSSSRAGVLNFSIPGEFEESMPAIAEWFAEHPPGDA
jgi:mannose-6-phosphate isomerase-like protein (cupin superfamily)